MSPAVRVLHVFSTFAAGGPQVRTARLLPELEPSWRHAILALDGCTDARGLLAPELGVEFVPAPPRASTPRTALALARLLRARRPDLLLTYNWGAVDALLASRLAGPRAVVHHEDGFRPDEVAAFKRRRIWLRRALLPRCSGVIVPSFVLEGIARELWRLPARLVQRIPNGIRPGDFSPADRNPARRRELGIPAQAPLVGYVGHLRAEKNPVRAVLALTELPPHRAGVHLMIVGDGPERAAVEDAVRRHGLTGRVHLTGHRADPRDDYRAMDAFLISSDTEQMPVALLEAMASALPVVATDVGDVRRILPAEQGELVVPAADLGGLARALARLAADAGLRTHLGQANRERVAREFSFEGMVAAYRGVYAAALRGAR